MQPAERERALEVFDAFLRFARDVSLDGGDLSTVITEVRSSAFVPGSGAAPSPAAHVVATQPVAEASVVVDDGDEPTIDSEVTRISPMPAVLAASSAPLDAHASPWEEPTRERPDVVRELAASAAAGPEVDLTATIPGVQSPPEVFALPPSPPPAALVSAPPLAPPVAAPPVESSIIVDDDTLTDPEFGPELMQRFQRLGRAGVGAPTPVGPFIQELVVLIKYGHADQARGEAERWVAANPDDLIAHLAIAEFEVARLDRETGVQRFGRVVAALHERGDRAAVSAAVQRLQRAAPGDARVAALAARVGAA